MDDALERALHLARRELGAGDVHVLPPTEEPPTAPNVVATRLPDGRIVVVTFDAEPDARDAVARRLEMLLGSFAGALDAAPPASRPPVRISLHDELRALAQRANALDAAVVDADSPVLWGSASTPARPRLAPVTLPKGEPPRDDASSPHVPVPEVSGQLPTAEAVELEDDAPPVPAPTLRALERVRDLDDLVHVKRGRPLRRVLQEGDDGALVLSFSGIYLLVLVYDGAFDELRAERAAQEALPRIESLVSALPPIEPDPQPMGAVVAFRRGKRRQ